MCPHFGLQAFMKAMDILAGDHRQRFFGFSSFSLDVYYIDSSPREPCFVPVAFYEYRMVINSECWNIIIDENMKEVPSNFPGSSSVKLTHDFCHVDSDNSDDVYTNYSFVEMGVAQSGPFTQPSLSRKTYGYG